MFSNMWSVIHVIPAWMKNLIWILKNQRRFKFVMRRTGLNRHQLNKHNRATSDSDLDNQIVKLESVKQSQDKIYGDENFPLKFRVTSNLLTANVIFFGVK